MAYSPRIASEHGDGFGDQDGATTPLPDFPNLDAPA
jgi:hypothetical protein